MVVKYLDIEYFRKQGSLSRQVIIASSSTNINTADNVFIVDNKVGIRMLLDGIFVYNRIVTIMGK